MASSLFIYQNPFVVKDTSSERDQYLFDYLSEQERTDEKTILSMLLSFAVTHELLKHINAQTTGSTSNNMGSWKWIVSWTNFRSLVEQETFYKVLGSLQADDQHALGLVIDLHVRMGSLFHPKLLNTLTNRIIQSVKLIPHDTVNENIMTWEDIHQQAPFMWVLILLQVVIKSHNGTNV
jgi:hypothetical protein